ncbi:hypothetical protein C8R44DRAFT_878941 [Mycena epipterygia]|nr:hypothetical protein C8R44DRAFT_878941 [Mycena epipterygia]
MPAMAEALPGALTSILLVGKGLSIRVVETVTDARQGNVVPQKAPTTGSDKVKGKGVEAGEKCRAEGAQGPDPKRARVDDISNYSDLAKGYCLAKQGIERATAGTYYKISLSELAKRSLKGLLGKGGCLKQSAEALRAPARKGLP